MQTDPNWSNFLYNERTKKVSFPTLSLLYFSLICSYSRRDIDPYLSFLTCTTQIELIDFGASQEYSQEFIDLYGKLLSSAVKEDRESSIRYSRELGYFTGEENEVSSFSLPLSI